MAVSVHPAERPAFNGFASVLRELEAQPARAPIETRLRAEPGQSELWLLLGSPCGTLAESNDNAGQSALALTMAAHATSADVALEPWITPDAVGLLAHAPRRALESATEQAERVARALARARVNAAARAMRWPRRKPAAFGRRRRPAPGLQPAARCARPRAQRLARTARPLGRRWRKPIATAWPRAVVKSCAARCVSRSWPTKTTRKPRPPRHAPRSLVRPLARRPTALPDERGATGRSGELSLTVPDTANTESAYLGLPFPSRLKFERQQEPSRCCSMPPEGRSRSRSVANTSTPRRVPRSSAEAARARVVIEIRASDDDARKATLEVRRALDRFVASQ